VFANTIGLVTAFVHPQVRVGGLIGIVDRLGPPLFTAIAAAVAAWNPHVDAGDTYAFAMARLAFWAVAAVALLVAAFRRVEIES
jgi:hypothetical protein